MTTETDVDFSVDEFVDLINKMRRAYKNKWHFFVGLVEGKKVYCKTYNTTIERLTVDGIHQKTGYDLKVSVFSSRLREAFN
jgi:hypothetical protein